MDDDVQSLPIDIHAGKLVEWLVSRQHASQEWAETTRSIREKILAAIQDMPEHPEITELLKGTYINYFHCLKIVELLRETEADSKNILGWYTSQRMKDWQSIVKLYEKGGASLAESGQLVHRYVAFEIPGIRAQVARCGLVQEECDKKEADIHKAASNARAAYLKQCKHIGITGDDVRQELLGLLAGLPSDLASIGDNCQQLQDSVKYYLDFVAFTCEGRVKSEGCLHSLRYLIDHGNVTAYEKIHGVAPTTVEDPTLSILKEDQNTGAAAGDGGGNDGIDFGGDDDDGIDFGGDGAATAGGEIDFGDDAIDFGGGGDGEIDWEVTDAATDGIITVEGGGGSSSGRVAKGEEALTILQSTATRDAIHDDIIELEGFLQQRLQEEGRSSDQSMMTMNLWDDAPQSLQMVSVEQIRESLEQVKGIVQSLTTPKMLQLFLISASHRYVDRLCKTLQQSEGRGHVSSGALEAVQQKRLQSSVQQQALLQQLDVLRAATKRLCGQLQEAISDKYKGRPVNIMGVMQNL